MEQITAQPVLTPLLGTFKWRLDAPFEVMDEALGKISIPQGFISDLGSIPRLFWGLLPPIGPATPAYLVHDWLYAKQSSTRKCADDCLLRLLAFLDVGYASRYLIYWNVRAWGWVAWKKDGR